MPVFQLLIYPVTDYGMEFASYRENSNSKPLSSNMMPWFWKHYLKSELDGFNPYASPLRAKDLFGLPPTLVQTVEHDPLRDEGEAYAKRLSEAGVPVTVTRYNGLYHEAFGLAGVVPKADEMLTQAAEHLKVAFAPSIELAAR
jgi:acetyl esterase